MYEDKTKRRVNVSKKASPDLNDETVASLLRHTLLKADEYVNELRARGYSVTLLKKNGEPQYGDMATQAEIHRSQYL